VALNYVQRKLAKAGWFDAKIFVQPVSTDAGAALGAALW
jgi:predicted NodU family carbamoyl transferase